MSGRLSDLRQQLAYCSLSRVEPVGNKEDDPIRLRSLEYFLTDRCNLRCDHCSASSPYLHDPDFPELSLFRQSLESLKGVLFCDQIKVLGGEPLLNPAICDFLEAAKGSGIFKSTRVATNGVLLHRMEDRFWRLADIVEVSLYPRASAAPSEESLAASAGRASSLGSRLEVNRVERFMVSIVDSPIEEKETVQTIYSLCGEAHGWSCHLLYGGRLYRCSRVPSLDRYLSGIQTPHASFTETDGIAILGTDGRRLREEIRSYLGSNEPLNACEFCLGTSGVWQPWRELPFQEIKAKRERHSLQDFRPELLVSPFEALIRASIVSWEEAGKWTPPAQNRPKVLGVR